jgi:hypothetical protein
MSAFDLISLTDICSICCEICDDCWYDKAERENATITIKITKAKFFLENILFKGTFVRLPHIDKVLYLKVSGRF